jgi:hypothetical protein
MEWSGAGVEDPAAEEGVCGTPRGNRYVRFGSQLPYERLWFHGQLRRLEPMSGRERG